MERKAVNPWGWSIKLGYNQAEIIDGATRQIIIHNRAEIEPAPSQNFEVGTVGLPELIDGRRLVLELTGGLDHDEGRAGDLIMGLQGPIRRSL